MGIKDLFGLNQSRKIAGIVDATMSLDRVVRNQGDQGSVYDECGMIFFSRIEKCGTKY